MNAQMIKLFGLVVVLFTVLIAFTSYRSVFAAGSLRDNPDNKRELLESQRVRKGEILGRDESVIARDVPRGKGAARTYSRTYPQGSLLGQPVGYNFLNEGRTGLESSYGPDLAGQRNEFNSLLDQLKGAPKRGTTLKTALDPAGQREAIDALAGRAGAVVAMEPKTGRIRVMASVPPYDPNRIPEDLSQLNNDPKSPLVNRATQSGYPPGSTFKVVTASAAIDSGKFTPQSTIDGSNHAQISGVPLENFGGEQFGSVTLATALQKSINTAWARVALRLGQPTMVDYMEKFGLYERPPLDYPANQLAISGPRRNNKLVKKGFDTGRVAIGQGDLQVTPLQMAMVAETIANDGVMMTPRLGEALIDPDGREDEIKPDKERRVISKASADQVTSMMEGVVEAGTGTAAKIPGITVAGKTGTAEIDRAQGINQAWFLTFAPADNPKIAVVATVERSPNTGGEDALPIAKKMLERYAR